MFFLCSAWVRPHNYYGPFRSPAPPGRKSCRLASPCPPGMEDGGRLSSEPTQRRPVRVSQQDHPVSRDLRWLFQSEQTRNPAASNVPSGWFALHSGTAQFLLRGSPSGLDRLATGDEVRCATPSQVLWDSSASATSLAKWTLTPAVARATFAETLSG
jgi:hypothetical protein